MKSILKEFTPWIRWGDRIQLDLSMPGVYLLGRFNRKPAASVSPAMDRPLVYVGETCDQTLYKRLKSFDRSAFSGKPAHSGGRTFYSKFQYKKEPLWLYVSVLGVSLADPSSSAYIRYIERALLWNHVQIHDEYPTCNKK